MKLSLKIRLLLSAMLFVSIVHAQDSCQVVQESLKGNYSGDCKKGLANGQGVAIGLDTYEGNFKKGLPNGYGIYTWSTGEVYQGEWRKGQREGAGSYFYKVDGRDTVITGVWDNDKYIGKKKKKPRVIFSKNIDSYSIHQTLGIQNRVLIDFKQNGMQNTRVEGMLLNSDSGTPTQMGQKFGFDNVVFPVSISVRYDTFNKLGTQTLNCVIEFTIYEEGDWQITLKN